MTTFGTDRNQHGGATIASLVLCALVPVLAASTAGGEPLESMVQHADTHLAESHRAVIKKIVVLPTVSPANQDLTGTYDKRTDGLLGGIVKGQQIGTISTDVGGIPIHFPIPMLQLPGAIIGGLSGAAKRRVQDFRDALTEDLANAADAPLSNDALAADVFWRLRTVPTLKPKVFALTTPIPADTDAILYVSFTEATINVQEEEAIITTSANATLRRLSDGEHIYEQTVHYQDRDTLGNWTRNDNQAWRDYTNYARHYLGREIAADLFERVPVQQTLAPKRTKSVSPVKGNHWLGVSSSSTPTLAWEHAFAGDNSSFPWTETIVPQDISYEVEIYDLNRLVYSAKKVPATEHMVEVPLNPCKTYRWSVRPRFRVDNEPRYGEWMRSNPDAANGNVGAAAATASAYIYDFAAVEIKCRRR